MTPKYKLIYTPISLFQRTQLARDIVAIDPEHIKIPAIDDINLAAELREDLEAYILISTDHLSTLFPKIQKKFTKLSPTILGDVPEHIQKLFEKTAHETHQLKIVIGNQYQIASGPLKNLIGIAMERNKDEVILKVPILREVKKITSSVNNLKVPTNPIPKTRRESSMIVKGKALVIDGHNALYRSVYGKSNIYNAHGRFVGGCHGVFHILIKLKHLFPEYELFMCFDGFDQSKVELFPEYKAQRVKSDRLKAAIEDNLKWCISMSKAIGAQTHHHPKIEGDDTIGSLVSNLHQYHQYTDIIIYSRDHDLYQLLSEAHPKIDIYQPNTTFRDSPKYITHQMISEEYSGMHPRKIPILKAIMGDDSDNIKSCNTLLKTKFPETSFPIFTTKEALAICNQAEDNEEALNLMSEHPHLQLIHDELRVNLKITTINTEALNPRETDPIKNKIEPNTEALAKLLQEAALFRDLENIEKNEKILQGVWQ